MIGIAITKAVVINIIAATADGAYIHSAIIPQKMIMAAINESAIFISHHIQSLTLNKEVS